MDSEPNRKSHYVVFLLLALLIHFRSYFAEAKHHRLEQRNLTSARQSCDNESFDSSLTFRSHVRCLISRSKKRRRKQLVLTHQITNARWKLQTWKIHFSKCAQSSLDVDKHSMNSMKCGETDGNTFPLPVILR